MKATCPICSESEQSYLFTISGARVLRCSGCELVRTDALAGPPEARTYWAGYETEADAAQRYLSLINQSVAERAAILLVAAGPHPLGKELENQGFNVAYSTPDLFCQQEGSFGCVVFLYTLEKFEDPNLVLNRTHEMLTESGVMFVSTPSLDSPAARFFGRSWVHWSSRNRTYFSRSTIQLLLERRGFRNIWFQTDKRVFNLEHVCTRLQQRNNKFYSQIASKVQECLPKPIMLRPMRFSTSGLVVMATKIPQKSTTSLSIIVPVFNERATVAHALNTVLAKHVDGVDERQVIIVESNSTDGSREIVRSFADVPGVKIVFEEKPRGKGHAVRTGLEHATGDIVLIQDADTEYDINDYDELLAPILRWRRLFVLGSRHQGDWKMRTFNDNPLLAVFFNFGQVFFTWLMNTLYHQRMTDPFTMYKLFRRECLFGLVLECNRFDFDHELVIKLVRKGYKPYEIPVNYSSRTYTEGKKVTIIRDPLTWIWADFKYRFTNPFKPFAQAYSSVQHTMRQQQRVARLANQPDAFSARDAVDSNEAVGEENRTGAVERIGLESATSTKRQNQFLTPRGIK